MDKIIAPLLLCLVLAGCLSACVEAPVYEGPPAKNFDGESFSNTKKMNKTLLDMIRFGWGSLTTAERWPDQVPVSAQKISQSVVNRGIAVTYINHSTVLIQVAGLNILTDPIYAERASPFTWAGPRRVHGPGIELADLPDIDVILISHNHYDHLDIATLQALLARQQKKPLILAGLGNGLLFAESGLHHFRDMQWDDAVEEQGLKFTFVECRHRSGRGISDQMKTLWGSFVIETPEGNIYFAGDTGFSPHFKAQGERFGQFEIALLPIGAYEPRWFMADVHLNPEEAVQAHMDLNARRSLAIHFGTFQLTYEARD